MERSCGNGHYRMWESSFATGANSSKDLLIFFFSILVFLLISRESTGGSKILYIVLALFLYALYKLRGQVGEEVWLNRTPPWLNGNPKPFFSVQLLQINPLARKDPLEPQ